MVLHHTEQKADGNRMHRAFIDWLQATRRPKIGPRLTSANLFDNPSARSPGDTEHCCVQKRRPMANHINDAEIQALSVTPYDALRDTLKSGDLLFASGEYLVSKAIQSVTRSPWSHVGIIFHLDSID